MRRFLLALALLAIGGPAGMSASAHDASLVLQRAGPTQLDLAFSVDAVAILQRPAVPRRDPRQVIVDYADMPAAAFQAALAEAEAGIEQETRLDGPDGVALALGPWHW